MRAGQEFKHLVTFENGAPTGSIAWALYSLDDTEITSGTVVPGPGAVSAEIVVAAAYNQLSAGTLRNLRRLEWTYDSTIGAFEYTIEGRVPLPVSPRGAREKIGVTPQELPDDDIDLINAYWQMQRLADISSYEGIETADAHRIADGIEALAALAVLDTLQVRIAQTESSGTNEFQRFKIDWEKLRAQLRGQVDAAVETAAPAGTTAVGGFLIATPADRWTNT